MAMEINASILYLRVRFLTNWVNNKVASMENSRERIVIAKINRDISTGSTEKISRKNGWEPSKFIILGEDFKFNYDPLPCEKSPRNG